MKNFLIKNVEALEKVDFGLFIPESKDTSKASELSLAGIVAVVIDYILYAAAIIAIIYLIYSGILYLTAAGNPDSAKKGQQGIINAVIGIVIISLVWVIAKAVGGFAGTLAN